jgi:hypothetical protein
MKIQEIMNPTNEMKRLNVLFCDDLLKHEGGGRNV